MSDVAGGMVGVTAALGTIVFLDSPLPTNHFPSPPELLFAIAAKTVLQIITGVLAGRVTTLTLEFCGDIAGRTYQGIKEFFEKKSDFR